MKDYFKSLLKYKLTILNDKSEVLVVLTYAIVALTRIGARVRIMTVVFKAVIMVRGVG